MAGGADAKNPCHACGQFGHWSRECPSKAQAALVARARPAPSRSSPSKPTVAEAEGEAEWALLASLCSKGAGDGSRGPSASSQYMEGAEVCHVSACGSRAHHALSTVSMSLHDVCWSLKELAFKVILDIGCMRSVVGVSWATEVIGRWRDEGRWHQVSGGVPFWGRGGAPQSLPHRVRGDVCGQGGGVWVQRGGWCVPSFVLPLWVHAAGGDH